MRLVPLSNQVIKEMNAIRTKYFISTLNHLFHNCIQLLCIVDLTQSGSRRRTWPQQRWTDADGKAVRSHAIVIRVQADTIQNAHQVAKENLVAGWQDLNQAT